ncbi:hypothetical protein GOP47_0006530 [Adiantum capillus-veneris]|uniref:Germin-like protein n=1 Tax=Adiantum capillus-veneris TaxID=13818 RepID=A0A9D4V3G1_ADICA|nr:hypothetical protein GOP47_0006530 [Adiantum capillus-veneris]
MMAALHVVVVVMVVVGLREQVVMGWDGDPEQDVCVAAEVGGAAQLHGNGQLCKPAALVTADDFVFRGLRRPATATLSPPSGVARKLANVREWPGLNTQGMSMVRADFEPDGVNPPHLHPRATEIALVSEGIFYAGFITSNGTLYAETLQAGDVMVFPRGLVHFQIHLGKGHGVLFGSLNSQDPGTIMLPSTLFGSAIPDYVLSKAFLLTHNEIHSLKSKFQKR